MPSTPAHPSPLAAGDQGTPQARRDLAVLLATSACVVAIALALDLSDLFHDWLSQHEHVELDEILVGASIISLLTGIFSVRRWRELARAKRREHAVAQRMKALADAAAGVTAARTPDELRAAIHDACARVLPFDTLLLASYRPETESLYYLGALDDGVWGEATEVAIAGRPAERVIREGKSLLTRSSADPAAAGSQLAGTGRRSESIIRTPLATPDGVAGLLSVQSYERDAYGPEDVEITEAVAAVAAPALRNLQLVAELRASEEALRESETRFRRVVESIGEALIITDNSGRITYANPRSLEVMGYQPHEMMGRHALDFFLEEEIPAMRARLAARSAGESDRYEACLKRADGTPLWVEICGSPLRDAEGTVVGAVAAVSNVNDRREAERALRDARAASERLAGRMSAVAQAASDFVGATSVEELRDVLREACARVLPFDAFTFGIYSPADGALHFLNDVDAGSVLSAMAVPLAGAPSEWVIRERRSLVTSRSTDPAAQGAHVMGTGRRSESIIRTPILDGERVLAVVSVQSYTPELYGPQDVEVLETVAALTGTALVNIRLQADRRASEAALRESEARYRMLADGTDDVVSLHDSRGRFLYASPSMEKLTGVPSSLIMGITMEEVVHPDDVWAARQALKLSLAGDPTEVEWRVRTPDGSYRWMATRATAIREGAGGELRLICSSRDVTARRAAEEARRESETRFRVIFEHAVLGITVADGTGLLMDVNPAMEAMLGYTREELQAMTWSDITHPDDVVTSRILFTELISGIRDNYVMEKRYLHRDGTVVWTRLVATRVRGAPGEPEYVIGMVDNTTEQHVASLALRESEAQLRAIFDEAPIGIALVDMGGRIVRSNRALQETLGYTGEELAGTLFGTITHPDDVGVDWEMFGNLVAGELNDYELEKRYFRKDGTMVRALLSVSLVQAQEGGARYALGMLEDITDRKAAEAALEDSRRQFLQAQKMEAVGRLAGGVAHDFNNMLTAIRGNAELLLMDTPEGDPKREDLEEIRRAADRSADLTRQLLAFSRQQVLQPRVLNLNQSVTTMERMLRRLIGEDVELSTVLEPGLGQVTADPGQVEQVVMNLAVNARDAMPRGGKLWVKTDNVYLAEGDPRLGADGVPGRYVALCVADTGCGMDADTLARIWEPFFTTKEQGKGTGLGLATVYGIVKQSGGTAWAESERDKGAAITVYLPRTDAESDADEVHGAAGPMPRGSETVLVVEDEIAVRMLTHRVLSRSGFRVIAASDPAEAIELYSAHAGRVDLVVTDLVMPGMDGMRLSEILRERDPSLRVLLTTGYSAEALDPERVRPDQEILLKPFDPGTLVRKVREILDRP